MLNRRFMPTDIGKIVNKFLEHFPHYVDYGFTAQMEDELDEISAATKVGAGAREVLEGVQARVDHVDESEARGRPRKRASSATIRPRQADLGAKRQYGPFVQMGTRDDEESRASPPAPAPAHRPVTLPRRSSCYAAARRSATCRRPCDRVAIGRFGPYVRTARSIRLDQGRRSVHDRAAARARADQRQGRGRTRTQSSISPTRHPGSEWPLRPIHHRRRRTPRFRRTATPPADLGRMPGDDRGRARARPVPSEGSAQEKGGCRARGGRRGAAPAAGRSRRSRHAAQPRLRRPRACTCSAKAC